MKSLWCVCFIHTLFPVLCFSCFFPGLCEKSDGKKQIYCFIVMTFTAQANANNCLRKLRSLFENSSFVKKKIHEKCAFKMHRDSNRFEQIKEAKERKTNFSYLIRFPLAAYMGGWWVVYVSFASVHFLLFDFCRKCLHLIFCWWFWWL